MSEPMRKKYAPGEPRPWQISFGPVTIAPGETVKVPAQPKVLFRSEKMIAGSGKGNLFEKMTWDSGGAEDLFVTQMFIGKKPQLDEPVPFTAMTSVKPFGEGRSFSDAGPSFEIMFMIENRGTESLIADITLIGKCVL